MKADLLLRGISQLVTAQGVGPKRGSAMHELAIIHHGALACAAGRIVWIGREDDWNGDAKLTIDACNRAVVPALVDPHTHAMWAGDRLADFDARTSGSTYEAILAAGGGIRSTIRATAAASIDELVRLAKPRVDALVRSGATILEVKSGYGFTPDAELAMLRAIRLLAEETRAQIVPTLLIHIPPPDAADRAQYVEQVQRELIPEAARCRLADAVDVFVEKEAWHVEEARTTFNSAQQHGLSIKLHTEQFHSIGGLELGVEMGALSLDHLEACTPQQFATISASNSIATILPGVSLHLGIPAAPGRKLIDAGAAVAVGTDLNPGSSPLFSASAALALAVRLNGLTAPEALIAGTVNAAAALGIHDAGRLEVGARADFLILEGSDWRDLIYTLGCNPVQQVWCGGARAQCGHAERAS